MLVTRRQFIKLCGAGAATALVAPRFVFSDAGSNDNILIVLFLRGGCDGLSLFPPLSGSDRVEYETARPVLKIPESGTGAALNLNNQFGIHPAAGQLKDLYDDGYLAVVRATGNTLVPSRSHFDAMRYLESGTPDNKGTGTGWLTRYFQSLPGLPPTIIIPSLAASSYTPTSFAGDPFVLTMDDPANFALNTTHWAWISRQQQVLSSLYTGSSANQVAGAHAIAALEVIASQDFASYVPSGNAQYPNEYLGDQFKMLAQVIKMDVGLRVATLDFGGWDTHAGQGYGSTGYFADNLVTPLAQSLSAFMTDIGASGNILARTTLVVQTEFSRRLRENADVGTDHGLASDMIIMGGAVNGGQIYGDWPGLANSGLFEGQDIFVTTDFRHVLGEILIRHLENPYFGIIFPGYTDYQPLGVIQGTDIPPVYDTGPPSDQLFSDGFED
ncbi:MAG: DUF1501 domain-containing protein [Chromatiaceae bacterium]|nr:DUF1501 domain-containing protein [Chromatiaceae bacterium]